jgi:enamine deaminase RidA (YjgF/YER057c/UK114 family)
MNPFVLSEREGVEQPGELTRDYFNLMVVDVDNEIYCRMINTHSIISVEQIIKCEIGLKMKEYVKNSYMDSVSNERVILKKFNALYTAFIPYFKKLKDFPKVALVAYFRNRNYFFKYALHVLKFIQQEMFPEVGVEVKLGVENLWFFLTPYIRD